MSSKSWIIACLLVVVLALPALGREWTDRAGNKLKGDFVRVRGTFVQIKVNNIQVRNVPFANLSDEDQAFVREELAKKGQESLLDGLGGGGDVGNPNNGAPGSGAPGSGAPGNGVPEVGNPGGGNAESGNPGNGGADDGGYGGTGYGGSGYGGSGYDDGGYDDGGYGGPPGAGLSGTAGPGAGAPGNPGRNGGYDPTGGVGGGFGPGGGIPGGGIPGGIPGGFGPGGIGPGGRSGFGPGGIGSGGIGSGGIGSGRIGSSGPDFSGSNPFGPGNSNPYPPGYNPNDSAGYPGSGYNSGSPELGTAGTGGNSSTRPRISSGLPSGPSLPVMPNGEPDLSAGYGSSNMPSYDSEYDSGITDEEAEEAAMIVGTTVLVIGFVCVGSVLLMVAGIVGFVLFLSKQSRPKPVYY